MSSKLTDKSNSPPAKLSASQQQPSNATATGTGTASASATAATSRTPSPPPAAMNTSGGGATPSGGSSSKYRISTTVKCIQGETVRDASLQEILTKSTARPDLRDPDTPMTGKNKVVSPVSGVPSFRDSTGGRGKSSAYAQPQLDAACFNPDAIATPHTYAKVAAPATPKKSSVGAKVFQFLNRYWNPELKTFTYRDNIQLVREVSRDALDLCQEARLLFKQEPALLQLPANLFVIGDVHGNYEDLHYFLSTLLLFHDIEMTPYSFLALGDYVDRGEFSVECVLVCLALKCMSPKSFFMLRGNHEDPGINGDVNTYGMDCFLAQSRTLFGDDSGMTVWQEINSVFQQLPLACIIDGKIFCSHGGIPRYYGGPESDDRLRVLSSPEFPRFRSLFEPLDMSELGKEKMERFWVAAFDLMWSDPSDDDSEMNQWGFGRNTRGNCIITFSEVAVNNFLSAHNMELMFRAHQEKSDGLKISKSAKCLTVFSSSNYQGHGNGAGVVYVGNNGSIKMITKESAGGGTAMD